MRAMPQGLSWATANSLRTGNLFAFNREMPPQRTWARDMKKIRTKRLKLLHSAPEMQRDAANPQSAGRRASEPFCCFCRESAANGRTNPRNASPSRRESSKRIAAERCRGRCFVSGSGSKRRPRAGVEPLDQRAADAGSDAVNPLRPWLLKRCSASAASSAPEFVSCSFCPRAP
jgi:hypothetical protein